MRLTGMVFGWLILWVVAGGAALAAQQISEKQDLSLFKLNYYGAPVYQPQNVKITAHYGNSSVTVELKGSGKIDVDGLFQQTIGAVDGAIQKVFVDLGRFNIISMPQRLTSDDVGSFIQAIKDFKEKTLVIPDAVSFGTQAFTEADFNRLTGSFIIVIPSVTFYDVVYVDKKKDQHYQANVSVAFSFVDAKNNKQLAQVNLDLAGSDPDSAASALKSAVDSMGSQLTFEIRKIQAFQIASGITQILRGDVVLEFGKNMGLQIGDEYNITRPEQIGGYAEETPTGLLIIKEVREKVSIAQVIYADPAPQIGDQLREAPRIGVDLSLYGSGMFNFPFDFSGVALGVRATPSRGFFALRPIVDIGVVLGSGVSIGPNGEFPLSGMIGAEYNLYLGRFKIAPNVLVGGILLIPGNQNQNTRFGGLRVQADLKLSVLVTDTMEIFAEGGYCLLFAGAGTFNGIVISAGVTFK